MQGASLKRAMKEILDPELPLLAIEGNYLVSKRLRKERAKYLELSRKKSEAGKSPKKGTGDKHPPNGSRTISDPSPSSTPCSDSSLPNRRSEKEDGRLVSVRDFGEVTREQLYSRIEKATGDDDAWMSWWAAVLLAFEQEGLTHGHRCRTTVCRRLRQ